MIALSAGVMIVICGLAAYTVIAGIVTLLLCSDIAYAIFLLAVCWLIYR